MGNCCGAKADEETKKAEQGLEKDLSGGPVKDRGCTDIICLVFYICHWFAFMGIVMIGMQDGEPLKLYKPRDFKGDYCSVGEYQSHSKLMWTLNTTATVDEVAKQLVCSTASQVALQAVLNNPDPLYPFTTSDYDSWECACCLRPCDGCSGSAGLEDVAPGGAAGAMSSRMGDFTNPSSSGLFSSDSSNMGSFSPDQLWSEMTKFFVQVCMGDACIYPELNETTVSKRSWTYTPSYSQGWKAAWDILSTHSSVPQDLKDTIASQFKFEVFGKDVCPYHERYCIPFPGVAFKDLPMDYCMPQLDGNAVAALGTDVTSALEGKGTSSMSASQETGLGAAFGDMLATLDAFCAVAFYGFILGLCFMVALRFIVGTVVWMSLGVVFLTLLLGGGMMYVRSYQCSGYGLFQTIFEAGMAAASAAATTISQALSGDIVSEAMTGDGEDYRGAQTISKKGYFCQDWDSNDPHTHNFKSSAAVYNASDLEFNYCRNPTGAGNTIFCFTTDSEKRWDSCLPVGVIFAECENGFEVQDETMREVMKVVAYIIWGMAGIWIIAVCCLLKRIRLAVAINKVAAEFVSTNPNILLVPIGQMFITFFWVMIWVFCASFLLSQVPVDYTPDVAYETYAEAYGTYDVPGACTGSWPAGIVYKYEGDINATNDTCSGVLGDITGITPKCWKCAPPRYAFDTRFAGAFFSLLWTNAFIVAFGELAVAMSVSTWFFTTDDARGEEAVVKKGLKTCCRYHLGTVAFGSFILAVVQFIKYMMKYLEKQAAAQKNRVMVMVFKVLQCVMWCFEKCVKFLNKNAYIQTALMGTNFCTSAKNAFFLIMRNIIRFGTVAVLGNAMMMIGLTIIICGCAGIGYLILQAMYPDISPVVPMMSYIILGYMTGKLFMTTYALAVDTSLQCFIACEEMGITAEFVPGPLKKLVDDNPQKQKKSATASSKVAPAQEAKGSED